MVVTVCEDCVDWNILYVPPKVFMCKSQSARTVWIEITHSSSLSRTPKSQSARTVWIEIGKRCSRPWWITVTVCEDCVDWNSIAVIMSWLIASHSLRGLCGLKFIGNLAKLISQNVTVCEDCVDWNWYHLDSLILRRLSQSARTVWIEIRKLDRKLKE